MREKWSSLLDEAFEIAEEDRHLLLLKSSVVPVRVVLDPRGEVDIDVFCRCVASDHAAVRAQADAQSFGDFHRLLSPPRMGSSFIAVGVTRV